MIVKDQARELLARMTLEEKASLCSGKNFWETKEVERLGIPSIMMTDGPHGIRKQPQGADPLGIGTSLPATCLPSLVTVASTWDRELAFSLGRALGDEARAARVAVVLGPGANIKRSPLCGRNFEYLSEDPYLTGEMAKAHILGIQQNGVGASLKHYAVNNQEHRRMTIDAIVDERTLREIYLAGFEIAVKEAQPATVMCAYNSINGVYCSTNHRLMTQVLKEEWGHEGLVVTDWGAMNRRPDGLASGVELEMPGTGGSSDKEIVRAIQAGELDEALLDRAVERLLALALKGAAATAEGPVQSGAEGPAYDQAAHHALVRRAAAEGAVLLKNELGILPLADTAHVAVIGALAKTPRFQGGGSSTIVPTQVDAAYDEMVKLAGAARLSYTPGYDLKSDQVEGALLDQACVAAKEAAVAVVFAGLTEAYEFEGADRAHMRLPTNQDTLIEAVAVANPNTVVVLSNGSPVEMPWIDQVPAVLEGYLGGQAGGGALADVIYGRVNPSGKLAETFPVKLADNPSHNFFPGGLQSVEYRESLFVGYRYYDTAQVPPLFPFGHGLSYTTFAYSDLEVRQGNKVHRDPCRTVQVEVMVTNSGQRAGKEVVQLYVRDVAASVFRPYKELKGFAKVALQPGESKRITLELDERAFAFYDVDADAWKVEAGQFEILIGASSADIRSSATIEMAGATQPEGMENPALAPYSTLPRDGSGALEIPPAAFEALVGRTVPPDRPLKKGEYTVTTPVKELKGTLAGWAINRMLESNTRKMLAREEGVSALVIASMMDEMPIKSFQMTGAVSYGMVEGMVEMANGRFLKGLWHLIKAYREKQQ